MPIHFKKELVNEFENNNDEHKTNNAVFKENITFRVENAEEMYTEKNGNFIKLYLVILNERKQSVCKLETNLFFNPILESIWSANTFCKATGQEKFIENEIIDAKDLIGLEGKAQVKADDNGYLKIAKYYPKCDNFQDATNKSIKTDPTETFLNDVFNKPDETGTSATLTFWKDAFKKVETNLYKDTQDAINKLTEPDPHTDLYSDLISRAEVENDAIRKSIEDAIAKESNNLQKIIDLKEQKLNYIKKKFNKLLNEKK